MAEGTSFLYLDPTEVSYGCALCGGETVAEVAVTSSDGTAHIDPSTVEDWFSAELLFGFGDDGSKSIVLKISALSMFNSPIDFRDARMRVYADGGGEAYLTVRQNGVGVSPYDVEVSPNPLEAPAEGGRTGYATVTVMDGTEWLIGFRMVVDTDTLPDWIKGVNYGSGDATGKFQLVVSANDTGSPREGTVYVGVTDNIITTVTVTQDVPPTPEWRPVHAGEFLDIKGNTWRVEVLRLTTDEVEAADLSFPSDSPLTMEWPSSGFEDALWGSSATLRVISDSDRRFIDLYTVEAGVIRLDVYKNGGLYWSGMLDPEFYEEPYERLSGYEVELTFTDFGILDRLKYDLEGMQAVTDIILHAVEASGINVGGTDLGAVQIGIGGLSIMSDNFTDEEGEVSSLSEALEGILQPLGVRMVQRGGRVILFDLAGLRAAGGVGEAVWAGDSQTLGVDKVYNSVTVTFSPYATADMLADSVSFDPGITADDIATSTGGGSRGNVQWWTYTSPDDSDEYSFNFCIGTAGSGVTFGQDAPLSRYFHILPIFGSADECSGIPYMFFTGHGSMSGMQGRIPYHRYTDWGVRDGKVFTTRRIYVPKASGNYLLRLVMEALIDCRYNPFSASEDNNYKTSQDTLEDSSAFVFLSAFVNLYDSEEGGTALWHLDNHYATNGGRWDLETGMHQWAEGAAAPGDFYFEWYDPDDLTDNGGAVGGWKGNRHSVGRPDGGGSGRGMVKERVSALLRNAGDGEYVPLPPVSGWLEITVGNDLAGFAYGSPHDFEWGKYGDTWEDNGVRDLLRWFLMKCPEVSVVKGNLLFDDADLDDVEYRGTLNESAQDDLSIDTICGTADGAPPTARGVFMDSDGAQVSELTRDGVTDRPEKLLIGQLYGQYAGRKTVLTGEAEIPETLLLTERNQEGRTFILMGDTQDVRAATSEIEIRELGEDRYTSE